MGSLFVLKNLWKSGRLALRLIRDHRVPIYAKVVPGMALLYVISPLDFVPDWVPVLGEMDDIAILVAGLAFFIRLCPPELVEEHESHLGFRPRTTIEGHARPSAPEQM